MAAMAHRERYTKADPTMSSPVYIVFSSSSAQEPGEEPGLFLGPAFPYPTAFTSNPLFDEAKTAFENEIDTALLNGINGPGLFNGSPLNRTSFSINMFSPSAPDMLYEYHHTDPTIRRSAVGTREITGDSVFRVGSISKLITVYLLLVLDGGLRRLSDPVTDYIPELAGQASQQQSVPVAPDWTQITVGDLASHLAGIARDYALNDLAEPWDRAIAKSFGLPDLASSVRAKCDYFTASDNYDSCTKREFLSAIAIQPALFIPGHTPAYSNIAFSVLGVVIERIYASCFEDLLGSNLSGALGMIHTTSIPPGISEDAVVPLNASASDWNNQLRVTSPAAGLFSSTNDLAAMGNAILNSTLLPQSSTRRWLKPNSHTVNPNYSVGSPWEIRRIRIGSRLCDLYTKDGNWGAYASTIILIPDFNVGFSALAASYPRPQAQAAIWAIKGWIDGILVPALETVAREQARETFAGLYADTETNSSLSIYIDDQPGLKISTWTSNGLDVIRSMRYQLSGYGIGTDLNFRLFPNLLYPDGGRIVGFAGTARLITGDYPAWESIDGLTYGSIGIDNFVFEMDADTGVAASIEPLAYRTRLVRES